jgi:hypothetical protein
MKVMKRLVSATLAMSLLGGSAAVAAPYDHGGQGYNGGFGNQYRGHDGNNGGAVVAGVGILALAAILASQHRHRHYHQGWYGHDGYSNGYNQGYGSGYNQGYGYDNGYNRGYGNQYGNGYNGYGDNDRR